MIQRLGSLYISKRRELKQQGVPDWWDRVIGLLFVVAAVVAIRYFPFFVILLVGTPLAVLYAYIKHSIKRRNTSIPRP